MRPSNFTKCFFPPACLGGPNIAHRGRFLSDKGVDLSMVNSPEICNPQKGYKQKCDRDPHNRCRLCATCEIGYRRRDIGSALLCDLCPPKQANKFLLALGALLIFVVVGLMVFNHIGTGGKKSRFEMRKVIIINYLQTTYMIANMDVPWPDQLSGLFQFTGAVSTVGEQLINPVCELSYMQAAEVAYSKQLGYLFVVPLSGTIIWGAWQLSARVLGRNFAYRGPDGRSPSLKDGFIATMVFLMYLMYPTLCRQAFALFICTAVGDKDYMIADLQEECWVGRHMTWIVFCSIPQIFLHVLGFPAIGLYAVYRKKRLKGHSHDKSFSGLREIKIRNTLSSTISLFKFGMLYSAYGPNRWYWDAIIAFKKASIAFLTSFVTKPELEVHWVVFFTSSFILLNEFGKPYNDPVKVQMMREAALKAREKKLKLGKSGKKKLTKKNRIESATLVNTQKAISIKDPGEELQRLDSLTCYVSMITAWSGLFFILFPYCSDYELGCSILLGFVLLANIAFFFYCVYIFREHIVKESKRICSLLLTCRCCREKKKEDGKAGKNGAGGAKRNRRDVHGNPLLYRKSFAAFQNTVNPLLNVQKQLNEVENNSQTRVLQLKALKREANARRSEMLRRLKINRRLHLDPNAPVPVEWTRLIGNDDQLYFYNPRTEEIRSDDPTKDWIATADEEGDVYYYHKETLEVRWDDPSNDDGGDDDSETKLWISAVDQSGDPYYYHRETQETRWTNPYDVWELCSDPQSKKRFFFHKKTKEIKWIGDKLDLLFSTDSASDGTSGEEAPASAQRGITQTVRGLFRQVTKRRVKARKRGNNSEEQVIEMGTF